MTTYTISSGLSSSNLNLKNGDKVVVLSGGIAYYTQVNSGSSEVVSSGGESYGAIISSGGGENILSGGVAYYASIRNGAVLTVSAGATIESVYVSSGGKEVVLSGGQTSGGNIYSGGVEIVSSGGMDSAGNIYNGGKETVLSGGKAYDSYAYASGGIVLSAGSEYATSGSSSWNVTLSAGSTEQVASAANAWYTTIGSGAVQNVSAGAQAYSATLTGGGSENIASGGYVNGTTINSGGLENIASGGTVNADSVKSGAVLTVSAGAVANNTYVSSGGQEVMLSGGVTSGSYVYSGGVEIVSSGGVDSASNIYNGGKETILSGGKAYDSYAYASGGIVLSAGSEYATSGSSSWYVTLSAGGTEQVASAANAWYTTIGNGAVQNVSAGAHAYSATLVGGGSENIASGGYVNGTTINSGGLENIASGGSVYSDYVKNGAVLTISTGAVANNTYVSSGGQEAVLSGGVTSGSNVYSGATEVISNGGVDSGSNIYNGGKETVLSGGKAYDSYAYASGGIVLSAASEYATSGSSSWNVTLSAGSTEQVASAANAWYTTIGSGAVQNVSAGAHAYSATLVGGGSENIASGGYVNGTTINSGSLENIASGGVANGDNINSGAVLMVAKGAMVDNTYVNNGGQEIVLSGGVTSSSQVYSGGTEVIASGGVDSGSNIYTGGSEIIASGGLAVVSNFMSGITINGGATLDFAGVSGASASINASNQLRLLSGGNVIETIGLNGNNANYTFATKSDGHGGTDVVVSSLTKVTAVSYDAGTGKLVLTGSHLTTAATDYLVSAFTLTGDGNHTYSLTGGSVVFGTPTSTGATIQLSTADQLAVAGLLNQNGTTAYQLSAPGGWDQGANALTLAPVTVSNVAAPTISGVAYNAATGVLTITGSHFSNYGAASGIALADLTLSGGSGSYTFSAANGDQVTGLSASGFSIQVSAADQAKLNAFVTANGTATLSGSAYNLAALGNWDSDSGAAITTQAVSVSGVPQPLVTAAAYNEATGKLTLTGVNFSKAAGFTVADFTLTGDGGTSYKLTAGSAISGATTATSAAIQLSAADQLAVDGLLNKNGLTANDGKTAYNLAASPGWDTGASALTTQAVNVSAFSAPAIGSVSYNAASGLITVTGSHLTNHGTANGIAAGHFKFSAGASSYTLTSADIASKPTATGFTIQLSPTDAAKVNAFVTANGTAALNGSAYNLSATGNWDSDSGAAISVQSVTVTGAAQAPAITGVAYNAASGQLTLTGSNFTAASGFGIGDFTLTGDGNASYTLTSGSAISGTPTATSAVIQLSAADMLAVNGLLNANGGTANDGKTLYNLAAVSGWDTGGAVIGTQGITVSNVAAPAINGVSYNAASGVLTVTGSNLVNHGAANGIAVADLTLSGGSGSYTFNTAGDTVGNLTATGFSISLNAADQAKVNAFVTANGTTTLNGSAYNLSATANWDSDSGVAITTQAVGVSGVLPVQITAANVTLPANVAADAKGDLYVNDLNGIDEIVAGGGTSNLLSSASLGLGLFATPLAADNSGDLYLGVQGASINGSWVTYGIAELAAGSHMPQLLANLAAQPLAICVDQTGDVYAALANDSIVEVAAGSSSVTTLGTGVTLNGALGVAVDGSGNLYIGQSNGSIVELAAGAKTLTTLVAAGAAPAYAGGSLGVDKAGDVYYLSGSASQGWSVAEIAAGTHAASTLDSLHTGTLFVPKGVSADASGNVYVADYLNGSVQEIVNPNAQLIALTGLTHHA